MSLLRMLGGCCLTPSGMVFPQFACDIGDRLDPEGLALTGEACRPVQFSFCTTQVSNFDLQSMQALYDNARIKPVYLQRRVSIYHVVAEDASSVPILHLDACCKTYSMMSPMDPEVQGPPYPCMDACTWGCLRSISCRRTPRTQTCRQRNMGVGIAEMRVMAEV